MLFNNQLHLLGYGYDIAGATPGSAQGPLHMQKSHYMSRLQAHGLQLKWEKILTQPQTITTSKLDIVAAACGELAALTFTLANHSQFFTVLGGDHSSAIGTWSGVAHAYRNKGSIGLIWIDAHMDSHTFETTPSGNIHGMPLASLLGQGDKALTSILDDQPKLLPENVCLIGIRSYEPGEEELLNKLNVRIFYMDEVKERGLAAVMKDAVQWVSRNTQAFGISIDIDSMDPQDAPGTGVAEPDGIPAKELLNELSHLAKNPHLIGLEIAEFNPGLDKNLITEALVVDLMSAVTVGKIG